ncbi:MAG: hypothetical protein M1825_001085 [Sarcosagium campestre]|nr:MAG: hypothetical protein M1825_001085 [Sarcosagium campestre]
MDGNEDDETQSGRDVKLCNDVTAPESKFRIDSSSLPNGAETEMDYVESFFFKSNGPNPRLPTPAEVRALSPGYDKKSQPLPVRFEHLGLIVKFGRMIAVAEAQSLWVIKRVFGEKVPVPEVYGWRVDDGRVYIYMQLIQGPTLKERWDTLSVSDKAVICDDLRQMITSLRRAEQNPHDIFIGAESQSFHPAMLENQTSFTRKKGSAPRVVTLGGIKATATVSIAFSPSPTPRAKESKELLTIIRYNTKQDMCISSAFAMYSYLKCQYLCLSPAGPQIADQYRDLVGHAWTERSEQHCR